MRAPCSGRTAEGQAAAVTGIDTIVVIILPILQMRKELQGI